MIMSHADDEQLRQIAPKTSMISVLPVQERDVSGSKRDARALACITGWPLKAESFGPVSDHLAGDGKSHYS